jgi:aryl-alcohol dehydrogenase-like predicted oxidoreductase
MAPTNKACFAPFNTIQQEEAEMETRRIGSLRVSVVGLGCNNFGGRLDEAASARVIAAAIDAGINFFDTADIYGGTKSEEFVGRALASRRKDIVIATKFGVKLDEQRPGGAHPEYIKQAVDASLHRLGTDHIDLYQLHVPDPKVPIADTRAALDVLVKAGKVREIGCSNFTADQLREAETAAGDGARFVSVQNHYSMLHRDPEREVLPECERQGLAFLPYFPLANGLLTGKYRKGHAPPEGARISGAGHFADWLSDENLDRVEALIQFAEARGHTVLELAVSWLLARPTIASVIAGATKPDQILANVGSANWRLTSGELAEVAAILGGK